MSEKQLLHGLQLRKKFLLALSRLTLHCPTRSIINNFDSSFWSLSDHAKESISKDSLLRIMRGIQFNMGPNTNHANMHVGVASLVLWQADLNDIAESDENDDVSFSLFD